MRNLGFDVILGAFLGFSKGSSQTNLPSGAGKSSVLLRYYALARTDKAPGIAAQQLASCGLELSVGCRSYTFAIVMSICIPHTSTLCAGLRCWQD